MNKPLNIAIVGVGGFLPGADDLAGFWANVVAGRDCARDVPPGRWPLDPASVLQPGDPAPDKTYSLRGYYLNQIPHDPAVDSELDPLFHLAVACSRAAWSNARTDSIDRRRVGVVLGSIALPTEHVSAINRRKLEAVATGDAESAIRNPQSEIANRAVVGRPALLVADVLGLGGLCLTLDAACASSLYALKIACDELTSGRAEAMLAGGLNRSDSLYTQMGFAQLRALSPTGRCSPFDATADGLLVGEGGVVFVLKRLADAERDGDHIYGVIAGIGLSNDVGGGLLAPSSKGQLRAMRAAYEQAGWRPGAVDFVECHATGTPVGDAVELWSLRELRASDPGRCWLGATKSNVGHLLTGAGAAALLKVLLAMRHETIPPIANFRWASSDSPAVERSETAASASFEFPTGPKPWSRRDSGTPRRAAINAFGFGGINAHVLVEEYFGNAPIADCELRIADSHSEIRNPKSEIVVIGLSSHFAKSFDAIDVPLDRVRTPPSELQASLPQQLLLLRVAAEALDDAGIEIHGPRTGAFVGIALDPNTTNFDFRWTRRLDERDAAGPPLTADRVMGHLGSIAASRLARCFDFGGPSFTVSAEGDSGMFALQLAVEALERLEIDCAVVAAVDFPSDIRLLGEGGIDGAAAIVLMRHSDAKRLHCPIAAVIGEGSPEAAERPIAVESLSACGAAASMAAMADACRRTEHERISTAVRGCRHQIEFQPSSAPVDRPKMIKSGRVLSIPVRRWPMTPRKPKIEAYAAPPVESAAGVAAAFGAVAQAHEAFLRFSAGTNQHLGELLAQQSALLEQIVVREPAGLSRRDKPGGLLKSSVFLDRAGCLEFAVGKIAPVLGPEFAVIDSYPTRVRLPDEPLMLADRIVSIEGEPRTLTRGRIVTEHDVYEGRWYLDHGVVPACIAIESGQADLFLSAYLGADFHTMGRAVYRLLDAAVTFHRDLPRPGEVVRYDIRIKEFFRQGETLLFRFEFDGTIDGQPLLTMRDGCAGFFTPDELAGGRGVVHTELQRRPMKGKAPPNWKPPVAGVESYSAEQLDHWRRDGRLPAQEKLRLIHRVPQFDPAGGRFGLGLIRGEADIHPDDWFLTCHFVDDQVMPGTLMYECCLHTLRIALLRFGWNADAWQPVIGVTSRLKCRGQVTAATRTVAYEVSIKEIVTTDEPYVIADALMYADGKPIVDVQDMTLRVQGGSPAVECQRDSRSAPVSLALDRRRTDVVFTREQILEFATGSPSSAFGERYAPFDRGRFIARLPAPPYSFIDRVVSATVRPWEMVAGGSAIVEHDVPPDAWHFAAARQPRMPYAVLLEVALQSCGWISAYVGSALHSNEDLHYRNLGGNGTVHRLVGPDTGTLSTTATLTKVSKSAGMIIQNFDFAVRDSAGRDVYTGNTYFGFFTSTALAEQVGIREAQLYEPPDLAQAERCDYPAAPPFPAPMLRMLDRIDCWLPDGGPHGLGFIRGSKTIDPGEWFFEAHFHQDPVWPGSLGLEAFLQLLQFAAARRWGWPAEFESPAVGTKHHWTYRGQVLPSHRQVTVQAEITRISEAAHTLLADGWLLADGRPIYQIKDFAFRHTM